MFPTRSPLSVKKEKSLSGQMDNMALDKENTVRTSRLSECVFQQMGSRYKY